MSKRTLSLDFDVDERGVSPVIGVILMVAITVILAAVIGAFVLNLGSNLGSTGPNAQLSASCAPSSDGVTISHKGGDPIKVDEVTLQSPSSNADFSPSSPFSVGDKTTIVSSGDVSSGDTVTVTLVHNPSESILIDTEVNC
ncbi:type IV pilin [Halocalculus aciditolerans]|uniref:Archaeal Type IV pilin N-terminal domain-containing protein n=1 Tax=Halocalculus aciditolerans TaxID=1383812 RepID=A0A830FNE8_9EURY|nr:type IV pilin N-terminal domain-containing protein [Halocalculus aciditolerans]GGL70233.1 hypothetical protein GCM10009039_30360 [Halocalculus aciditolerans]